MDKPRSLEGLTPVRHKSETQCYHDLRRPGSAVRMFMRPFVWAECAQHIHVNVLPGCFQIRRANPKRLQLLKRVRPRNTMAPFVRVRCAEKRTILAHLERRAVHMGPRTWRLPHVMSVHRASLARRHVTGVRRASLARRHVTSVHRASLARGRFPHVTSVLAGGFRLSQASTAPVSLAGGFRMSRASTACHERPPRQSRSRAVSACHECPPHQSRSRAVFACHERSPRQSRSRAVSACHERPAPVSFAGGFCM